MTSEEKLRLIQQEGGCWFKTKMDLTEESISIIHGEYEAHWHRYENSSCSVYFYNHNNERIAGMGYYTRYGMDELDRIYKYLENVVLITKTQDAEPLWYEPIVQCGETTYHAIGGRYYSEQYLQNLIQADQFNTEMATGVFKIKDKQYTKSELEKIVALAEQFSSLTK